MTNLTKDRLKEKAKLIRAFLNDKYQVDISHGHCMELTSQIFGFKDWNTASAAIKSQNTKESIPTEIKTVGDLKKALAPINDDAYLDAEYEFELIDFLNEYEPELPDMIHSVITQEFTLSPPECDSDICTIKLNHAYESASL